MPGRGLGAPTLTVPTVSPVHPDPFMALTVLLSRGGERPAHGHIRPKKSFGLVLPRQPQTGLEIQ